MTKKERHKKILELINEFEIDTQEELTSRLNEYGCDVSQATVSRDIKELDLIKSAGREKKVKYLKLSNNVDIPKKIIDLYKHVTLSISYANNLIVIKTLSGNASSAGMAIDAMHFPQVLGTIAGDDVLLIIAKSNSDAETIVKTLRTI